MQLRFKHFPFATAVGFGRLDFDSSLGFPGEGPGLCAPLGFYFVAIGLSPAVWILPQLAWILDLPGVVPFLCASVCFVLRFGFCSHGIWTFQWTCASCLHPRCKLGQTTRKAPKIRPLILVALLLFRECHGVNQTAKLYPRDAGDEKRAQSRARLDELPTGRPVLGQPQAYRDKLLKSFGEWLEAQNYALDELLNVTQPDVDCINLLLERYGRELSQAGRPYNHYAETTNGVSARRPRTRRSLQQAWDVAFCWLRNEPPIHHVALPLAGFVSHFGYCVDVGLGKICRCGCAILGSSDTHR